MDLSKFKQFYHDIKDEIKDLHKHLKPDASEHVVTPPQQNHQQHQYQPAASHQHVPAQHQSYGVNDSTQEKQAQGAWVHGPPAFQPTPYGGPPPAQQSPATPVSHGYAHTQVNVTPTQAELNNVQMAASKLWELDVNRLEPGRDFQINLQNATKVHATVDVARDPFFKHVHENIFRRLPTYNLFYCLLDNYHSHTGTSEKVTSEEIREQNAFIAELLKTPVIQYCHKYLAAKRLAPQDLSQFGKLLQEIWFTLYKREVANDSSAFEV
ncbi:hypothetical protein HDU85_004212 [Gaertneriomyces sp. JEL0708]|nr:hypothetical protein HDU85_004212 [Gaertneriomyces sp. JEL0708]